LSWGKSTKAQGAQKSYAGLVPTYRATPVTDATAQALLTEYFTFRASTFPTPSGYRATYPDPTRFVAPDGVFLVVREFGEAIGCGGIRRFDGTRFEVKHLWLRPLARGRGLGRSLLRELERRAIRLGATELVLDTNASLEAAGELYRSSGFEPIEAYNDNPNATDWYRKSI
jgi:GNAT superfamily N-acetyltransferase